MIFMALDLLIVTHLHASERGNQQAVAQLCIVRTVEVKSQRLLRRVKAPIWIQLEEGERVWSAGNDLRPTNG